MRKMTCRDHGDSSSQPMVNKLSELKTLKFDCTMHDDVYYINCENGKQCTP